MVFFKVVEAAVRVILDKDNRLEVYIWNSSLIEGAAGHVALNLCEKNKSPLYYSLWPDQRMKPKDLGRSVPGALSKNYAEDVGIEKEKRDADHRIVFYHINIPYLRQKINRAIAAKCEWTANPTGEHHQNCATSVRTILDGCLRVTQESLTTSHGIFGYQLAGEVTPFWLRQKLEKLKKEECRLFPQTVSFDQALPDFHILRKSFSP